MDTDDHTELVRRKIESLRPRLLDLSRRNPLIATKFSSRSRSHFRIVDILPDVLLYRLTNGEPMQLVPLPDLDGDPPDEKTDAFKLALTDARLSDAEYLTVMEAIDRDADDYPDRAHKAERVLKDRVRQALALPPRAKRADIDLAAHARRHGIDPSFELPRPDKKPQDNQPDDGTIQTLLLPEDFERRLNAILSKRNTFLQQTGIDVLHVAFGFLEWAENTDSESSFSPLILCEVKIDKKRSPNGVQFWISASGQAPEINAVIAEKLRQEFGLELPAFGGTSVEEFFSQVGALTPPGLKWRLRRQIAIGVFPSARMAMYRDLDTAQPSFPQNDIVRSLLAGVNSEATPHFADDHEVDEPEHERKVPYLVMDADSSQFSTLVDLAGGINLAVEGPPGTGKSQTITNAIAAALAGGKKVLFVAEKLAALEVVKSRLEAVGLGEFLLPLQADRSSREQVIESIRARLDMSADRPFRDYDAKIQELRRLRGSMKIYLDVMATQFEGSGLTVREILATALLTEHHLAEVSQATQAQCVLPAADLNRLNRDRLRQLGARLAATWDDAEGAGAAWRGAQLPHVDRFAVTEACDLARRAANAFVDLAQAQGDVTGIGVPANVTVGDLQKLEKFLEQAQSQLSDYPATIVCNLIEGKNSELVLRFIDRCDACRRKRDELSGLLIGPCDAEAETRINELAQVAYKFDLESIDSTPIVQELADDATFIDSARPLAASLKRLAEAFPESRKWPITQVAPAHISVEAVGRDGLLRRNPRVLEADGVPLLQKFCREGREVQAEKAALGGAASVAAKLTRGELVELRSTLRNAGVFCLLSSRYRRAKRVFIRLSLTKRYKREGAVGILNHLIRFKEQEAAFNRQAEAAGVFGGFFANAETDFDPFERLAKFYQSVSDRRNRLGHEGLRQFLLNGDPDLLELLPNIPVEYAQTRFGYDELRHRLATREAAARAKRERIEALKPYAQLFRDPRSIKVKELRSIAKRVGSVIADETSLDNDTVVRSILVNEYRGAQTRTVGLRQVATWAKEVAPWSQVLVDIIAGDRIDDTRQRVRSLLSATTLVEQLMRQLWQVTQSDIARLERVGSALETAKRLDDAALDADGLDRHASFAMAFAEARDHGLGPLVQARLDRGGSLDGLSDQFEALAARQLARDAYHKFQAELTPYSGGRLDTDRRRFAALDREIIDLSRRQLRAQLCGTAKPPPGVGVGRKSDFTDMALLRNEIAKKQRFVPVRDLMRRARRALLELKPCWMMSPQAVAQYTQKGNGEFDLCIIDEASQMPPESAVGALLRCRQTMIVGDTNQLPPTDYFKPLVDNDDADEDETVLHESILELANATFRPARRLRWHYRSRHSGLIRFSNRVIYDDDLIIFPHATESSGRMGVEFRPVRGLYKSGINQTEARAMVDAIVEFMHVDADRSLGVVTVNQKQRELIAEEFEYAIKDDRRCLDYLDEWRQRNAGLEEFFIKNLENVQGDERDVIFIGTVYGPEEPGGRVLQRFPSINGLAGKRRLNVLFTRAKQKIVTFSSMTAGDILAEEHANPGRHMLKRWLEYSAIGVLEGGKETEREPDSDLERYVIKQIETMGCEAVPQVGVKGYFIDVGVRHQRWPHGFILGVECDGATYHRAKSARDRDRLRQEILEGFGWRLYRVWSTDWFNNPRREAERLRAAIDARLKELVESEPRGAPPSQSSVEGVVVVEEAYAPVRQIPLPLAAPLPPSQKHETPAPDLIEVGDTVRIRYLTNEKSIAQFTISPTTSDPSHGIVHQGSPVAKALLGAEKGEEVEVLVGSYVRPAAVLEIIKGGTVPHLH